MDEKKDVTREEFEALEKDYSNLLQFVQVLNREAACRGWDLGATPAENIGEPPPPPPEPEQAPESERFA